MKYYSGSIYSYSIFWNTLQWDFFLSPTFLLPTERVKPNLSYRLLLKVDLGAEGDRMTTSKPMKFSSGSSQHEFFYPHPD